MSLALWLNTIYRHLLVRVSYHLANGHFGIIMLHYWQHYSMYFILYKACSTSSGDSYVDCRTLNGKNVLSICSTEKVSHRCEDVYVPSGDVYVWMLSGTHHICEVAVLENKNTIYFHDFIWIPFIIHKTKFIY